MSQCGDPWPFPRITVPISSAHVRSLQRKNPTTSALLRKNRFTGRPRLVSRRHTVSRGGTAPRSLFSHNGVMRLVRRLQQVSTLVLLFDL